MTIGIGGWGSRRKPMSLVRAIAALAAARTSPSSPTAAPTSGILCATGKVKKLVYGFVSLDSIPLEPHFRAARQAGAIEAAELDEGMLQWGLYAAALRLPFLPTRAGPRLRRDAPSTRACAPCAPPTTTARSSSPMPALHPRRRAHPHEPRRRRRATASSSAPTPTSTTSSAWRPKRRFVSVRAHRRHRGPRSPRGPMHDPAHQPHDDRRRRRGAAGRALHRLRAGLRPRRGLPARVRGERAAIPEAWRAFQARVPRREPRRVPEARWRTVSDFTLGTRSARSPAPRPSAATARSSPAPSAPSPPSARAWRGRPSRRTCCSPTAWPAWSPTSTPSARLGEEGRRRLAALPRRLRHRVVGPAPRDDGRVADRPRAATRTSPASAPSSSPRRSSSACAARRATPSTTRPATGSPTTRRSASWPKVDVVSGVGLRPRRGAGAGGVALPRDPPRRSPTRASSTSTTPDHAMRLRSVHPGVARRGRGEEHRLPARRPRARRGDARAHRRRASPPARRHRPQRHSAQKELARMTGALAYPHLRSLRHPVPHHPDRHGLGRGRAADGGDQRGRRARHPRVGDDDAPSSWRPPSARCKSRTDRPFGVNLRSDQADIGQRVDFLIAREGEGRELRPGAAQGDRSSS